MAVLLFLGSEEQTYVQVHTKPYESCASKRQATAQGLEQRYMSTFSCPGNCLSDWGKLGLVHIVVYMLYTYTRPLPFFFFPFLFYVYVCATRWV